VHIPTDNENGVLSLQKTATQGFEIVGGITQDRRTTCMPEAKHRLAFDKNRVQGCIFSGCTFGRYQ
jgi:hypothetical protein